jgi:hypothetical protein
MITDADIFNLVDDVCSIATATAKLNTLSRDMMADNPELGDYQKDALEALKTIESYAGDVQKKCAALLASVEQFTPLSADEQALLNSWMVE